MLKLFQRTIIIGLFSYLSFLSSISYAGTHFTLKGNISNNYFGLNKQDVLSGSISVAFDLGEYLRVGVTHRQSVNNTRGYKSTNDRSVYYYTTEETRAVANSVDLTVILYYGKLFVPYVLIGMVKKDYYIKTSIADTYNASNHYPLPPVPNGGVGVGLRLNKAFSVKLSYTVSPGIKQTAPNRAPERALDTITAIGIGYNI